MPKRKDKPADDAMDELDFSKLVPIVGNGLFSDEAQRIKATYVVVDDATVAVTLSDGRRVLAPLDWYPRLRHATPAERNNWELRSDGRVVLWRSLRFGIAAKALVEGTKSNETRKSLNEWLAERKPAKRRKAG